MPKLTACLWFDTEAEAAAEFYCSVFPNSKITATARWPEGSGENTGKLLTVNFELDGRPFMGLNGGPVFKFTEATSFQIDCADQAEVDYYWDRLIADGGAPSECGWLKDRFGFSWQVVPSVMPQLLGGPDKAGAGRATQAMLKMKKLDIAALKAAYDG